MSYEIVYTSAPSGLKPGDKGFCVVGASKGIPPQKLEFLESLSVYRYVYKEGDPRNPLIFMHLKMLTGESVISRICDPGLDYSGRSNKLAHSVVLHTDEQPAGGPCKAMLHPDTFLSQWTGAPRLIDDRRIQSAPEFNGPCTTWEKVTGDAAWAAALAETARNGSSREAYVLYNEGTDCLKLIDEALSLLPAQDRWLVTFSTFFIKLPGSTKCQWRFIQKGQKEELTIPPHANVFKLDLSSDLGQPPASSMTNQARTGERPVASVKAKALPTVDARPTMPSVPIPGTRGLGYDKADVRNAHRSPSLEDYVLKPDKATSMPVLGSSAGWDEASMPIRKFKPRKQSIVLPLVITAVMAVLSGAMAGVSLTYAMLANSDKFIHESRKLSDENESLKNLSSTQESQLSKLRSEISTLESEKSILQSENRKLESKIAQQEQTNQPASGIASPTSSPTSSDVSDASNANSPIENKTASPIRAAVLRLGENKISIDTHDPQHLKKLPFGAKTSGELVWHKDRAKVGDLGETTLLTIQGNVLKKQEAVWDNQKSFVWDSNKNLLYLFLKTKDQYLVRCKLNDTIVLPLPPLPCSDIRIEHNESMSPWKFKRGAPPESGKAELKPNVWRFEAEAKEVIRSSQGNDSGEYKKVTGTIELKLNNHQIEITCSSNSNNSNKAEVEGLPEKGKLIADLEKTPIPMSIFFEMVSIDGVEYEVRCDDYQIQYSSEQVSGSQAIQESKPPRQNMPSTAP